MTKSVENIEICANCIFYRPRFNITVAPIKSMISNGICTNKHWENQPVIVDSDKDYCKYYEINNEAIKWNISVNLKEKAIG